MSVLASVYIPDFEVSLNGMPLPAEMRACVTSVTLEQTLGASDRVELTLANPELQFLDDRRLDLKTQLELKLGYDPDSLTGLFLGEVTGVEPSFPAREMPAIVVVAHDFLQRLGAGRKERAFPWYLPDSVVAAIVGAENLLLAAPDPAAAGLSALNMLNQRPRAQHKKSDLKLLKAIAAEYGFDLWADGYILNLKMPLPGLPPPAVELTWGESLVEFNPTYTSIGLVAGVTVKVWVEAIKTSLAVTASWEGDRITLKVMPGYLAEVVTGAYLDLPDIPLDTPMDAVKWVLGEMRRRVNNRITGKGVAIGDPRLRIGKLVALEGLGKRYSSRRYRLTSVTHVLDGTGYRTRFQVRQELI